MKLNTLLERASLNAAESDLDAMDDAYGELALLKQAFDKNDLGILINRQGKILKKKDLREIKRKMSSIVRNNPIIDGDDIKRGRDGYEKLRLFGRAVGHGVELLGTAALTGALGALTVSSVSIPILSILSGTATVGVASLAVSQMSILGSLKATSRLLNALDAYEDLNPDYKRSRFKRFTDWITRKSKKDIEKNVRMKIKKASAKARRTFEKSMRGFPETIKYEDSNGDIQEFPVADLFQDL